MKTGSQGGLAAGIRGEEAHAEAYSASAL